METPNEKQRMQKSDNTVVDISYIWYQRNNFCRDTGINPEYVMIHPINKEKLYNAAKLVYGAIETKYSYVFGTQIIWTSEINENDVIFTITSRKTKDTTK